MATISTEEDLNSWCDSKIMQFLERDEKTLKYCSHAHEKNRNSKKIHEIKSDSAKKEIFDTMIARATPRKEPVSR